MATTDVGLTTDFKFYFDGSSLFLGSVNCVDYSDEGFIPLSKHVLERRLRSVFPERFDCSIWVSGFTAICRALNEGDPAKAGFLVAYLPPPRFMRDESAAKTGGSLHKASVDDPKHPGWPKGAPNRQGGEFRGTDDEGNLRVESDRRKRSDGLESRRQLRSILRRILTAKRLWRFAAEISGDAFPADFVAEAATIADLTLLAREISADIKQSEAAMTFVEQGPRDLAALTVDAKDISFTSYAQFVKVDYDQMLEKRYGKSRRWIRIPPYCRARLKRRDFYYFTTAIDIEHNSLPKLIHEDVSAIYGQTFEFSSGRMPLRLYLRGKSFEQQHAWGLWALRQAGVLK